LAWETPDSPPSPTPLVAESVASELQLPVSTVPMKPNDSSTVGCGWLHMPWALAAA